jgi:hypothetical protein
MSHHIPVVLICSGLLLAAGIGLLNSTLRLLTAKRALESEQLRLQEIEHNLQEDIKSLKYQVKELQIKEVKQEQGIQQHSSDLDQPTPQDADRFRKFLEDFGPQSGLRKWLHESFYPSYVRASYILALDKLIREWDLDPTTYHDDDLSGPFDKMRAGIDALMEASHQYYFTVGNKAMTDADAMLEIPPDWKDTMPEKFDRAIKEIYEAWNLIQESYNELMRAAHKKKLT